MSIIGDNGLTKVPHYTTQICNNNPNKCSTSDTLLRMISPTKPSIKHPSLLYRETASVFNILEIVSPHINQQVLVLLLFAIDLHIGQVASEFAGPYSWLRYLSSCSIGSCCRRSNLLIYMSQPDPAKSTKTSVTIDFVK